MNHPLEYEMMARQKIETLTAEGLRNQEIRRQRRAAVMPRVAVRGQAQPPEKRSRPGVGIALRIFGWVQGFMVESKC